MTLENLEKYYSNIKFKMTPFYMIKIRAFFDTLLRSYQSQCACIFSDYIINKYGKTIQIKIVYYQPSRISDKLSLKYLIVINKILSDKKFISLALPFSSLSREISRVVSPAMDSYILAQFFSYMANSYKFRQICYQIENKMIYRLFKNALIDYKEKDPLLSGDQVLGLEIGLHGRIPTEAVRPRKTVQVKILGRGSRRLVKRNPFLINRVESVNPELGTFSVWIRQIV